MASVTRRTVVQAAGVTAAAALTPTLVSLTSPATATPASLAEPLLDIEAWFGPKTMAHVKQVYEMALVNIPDEYAGRPPLLTDDGRFNLSPEFRCALASLINDGKDVLTPDEPGMHRHYKSVLRKIARDAGVPMYGFIGELAVPPHTRMILLSRDEWIWHSAKKKWPVPPFRAYQWLSYEEEQGLIVPSGNAPARFPDLKPPPSERALSFEQRMAIFDAESATDPFFEGR